MYVCSCVTSYEGTFVVYTYTRVLSKVLSYLCSVVCSVVCTALCTVYACNCMCTKVPKVSSYLSTV